MFALCRLWVWMCLVPLFTVRLHSEVLIVADEFPAMQVLARRLKIEEKRESLLLDQEHLPASLQPFEAVAVYIHKNLDATAEHAFIDYAQSGGRLVLLHHSISSGKRQNLDWFKFLGVTLPQGDVEKGGYKWIEGVTLQLANIATNHFITTHQVTYPEVVARANGAGNSMMLPAFTLHETEVYLNHRLEGERTPLIGLRYVDAGSGKVWNQDTAGWLRPAGKGWVVYLMAGHTQRDFEDLVYGRIVLNAIVASRGDLIGK